MLRLVQKLATGVTQRPGFDTHDRLVGFQKAGAAMYALAVRFEINDEEGAAAFDQLAEQTGRNRTLAKGAGGGVRLFCVSLPR